METHIITPKKKTLDDIIIGGIYRIHRKKPLNEVNIQEETEPVKIEQFDDIEEQRMYIFVLRKLSPIDKGIQGLHAAVEYGVKFSQDKEYRRWSQQDKTVIMLDCGDCKDMEYNMNRISSEFGWKIVTFEEPDLNNLLTAFAVLVPKSVWGADTISLTMDCIQNGMTDKYRYISEAHSFLNEFHLAR